MRSLSRRAFHTNLLLGSALVGYGLSLRTSDSAIVQAKQADVFIDSISVATHFFRKAYKDQYTSGANLKAKLAALGVRHIRDHGAIAQAANANYVRTLNTELGIKYTLTCGQSGLLSFPPTVYNNIRDNVGFENVAGISGLNEPKVFYPSTYLKDAWDVQVSMWDTFRVNGVAAAKTIPIWSCSPVFRQEADEHAAYANHTSRCDGGNIHPYPGGRHPETTGWGSKDPSGDYKYRDLRHDIQSVGEVVGGTGRPMVATETGYRYSTSTYVSAEVAGIYAPRLFLHYFATQLPSGARVVRTSWFELFEAANNDWLLIRSNGTVTPAYTALKNLITVLKDPGPAFSPGTLSYTLSGTVTDVRTLLLQKRDGVFYLAIWLGKSIWDPITHTNITVNPQSVTLTFATPVAEIASNFPNANTTWTVLGTNSSQLSSPVEKRVRLLRIRR
jgi:hypothetical protein